MSADFTPEKEDYKILTPFKMQVLTNFPYIEADFDALTNYGLLCKVVEYLNNVIHNENEVTEQVNSLYNAYVSLQNYVNNYFDNLDLQEEVNNKIDELVENGTLTNLIKDYVDPIYEAFEEDIDGRIHDQNEAIEYQDTVIENFKTSVNQNITEINEKVDNATSGSPAGVYATVAALTSADPDHSKIYVVTDDGKWYYYNSGTSSWTAGGTYQSTGIANNSITKEMFSTSLDIDLYYQIYNKDLLNQNKSIIIPFFTSDYDNKFVDYDTGEQDTTDIHALSNSTLIYVPPYTSIDYNLLNSFSFGNLLLYFFDYNKTYKGYTSLLDFKKPLYFKEACYIRFMIYDNTATLTSSVLDNIEMTFTKLPNDISFNYGTNMVDTSKSLEGYYINASSGTLYPYASYNTTNYIEVEEETAYTFLCRTRIYLFYDEKHNAITASYHDGATNEYTTVTSPVSASYVRFSYYATDDEIMMYKGSDEKPYEPFKKILEKNASLSSSMINEVLELNNAFNILNGKKLVTCGDSFTEYTDERFTSGRFSGEYKSYPYLIALRNNMNIQQLAVSGSTITNVSGEQMKFSDGEYLNIASDADYILLKYGINDEHKNVAIGTIADTSNTTFYGAWNTVMSWIINNRPTAKIGIIITNGLTIRTGESNNNELATATINIAKKYGVPYLNEWNDPQVPLLLRTGRTDVAESIRNKRLETFRVAPDNTHENHICQEYESTFIEDFLRRL